MTVRILHCHSTFSPGGKEMRAVRLMNAWGSAAEHVILSGVPGALAAREAIAPGITVDFPDAPSLVGKPALGRYRQIARFMRGFDLVLTYNWGSMDAVMARRVLAPVMRLPPLIHHEDGFNDDEAVRQKPIRVRFRRAGLGAAYRVVVPSERLERIARRSWRQPAARVQRIANGVAVERFAALPLPGVIPGFVRAPGDVVVGTVAGLRAVKNLPRLVRMLAESGASARLVIVGDGPARAQIEEEAARLGLGGRVLLAGHLADPARYIGHFDVFALSSDSEQFPIALVEAMAAGLPVVSTDVGDVAAMVAPPNRPYVLAADDEPGLATALGRLIRSRDLRHRLGTANRMRANADFGEGAMIESYRTLYESAMKRPGALG